MIRRSPEQVGLDAEQQARAEIERKRGPVGGKRYVLNTAVITTPGTYHYELLSVEQAIKWLDADTWESFVRYSETADAMASVLGWKPGIQHGHVTMMPEEEALVFRLTVRIDSRVRGHLTPDFIRRHHEIGLLRRLS